MEIFWIQPKNHVMENHTMKNHVMQGITVVLIYRVSRCVDYDSAKKNFWCAKICNPFDLCDVGIKIKPESH